MNILGIETSCDETGIAIYNTEEQSIISEQLLVKHLNMLSMEE